MAGRYKSPLHETVSTTATDLWNDSCATEELRYAIEHGAVGATTNPTIVHEVLKQELPRWRDRIRAIAEEHDSWSEDAITWQLIEEMAVQGAELLAPVFEREKGRKGRLSIQTDPRRYRDSAAIVEQAVHFAGLAPNMQVKIPVTRAGLQAIEEATSRGVNINATVCFTVPQALAVGEALERGLQRWADAGGDVSSMTPVVTIMVGRLDDWLKAVAKRDGIVVTPGYLDWAGVACIKKAYRIFRERGYRGRLLAGAYRNHLHWSQLVGGDLVLTIPCAWQKLFNASDVEVRPRIDEAVDPAIVDDLYRRFHDFRRAYDEQGLSPAEFDGYGAVVRTLRTFVKSYHDLVGVVRDVLLPDPDVKY